MDTSPLYRCIYFRFFEAVPLPTGPRGRRSAALDCTAALRVWARPLAAAARRPLISALAFNPTATDIWVENKGEVMTIKAGETVSV